MSRVSIDEGLGEGSRRVTVEESASTSTQNPLKLGCVSSTERMVPCGHVCKEWKRSNDVGEETWGSDIFLALLLILLLLSILIFFWLSTLWLIADAEENVTKFLSGEEKKVRTCDFSARQILYTSHVH